MSRIEDLLAKMESAPDLSDSQIKKLRDAKIVKYQWIPEVLARMLVSRMPSNTNVEFDDLNMAGMVELTKQLDRIYNDKTLRNRLWNEKKKDLTVGPFFLKGLKSPYPGKNDSGSVKFIKGAILDEMRKLDPATPSQRQSLKKISKFKQDRANAGLPNTRRRVIKEKFKLTEKQLTELEDISQVN